MDVGAKIGVVALDGEVDEGGRGQINVNSTAIVVIVGKGSA